MEKVLYKITIGSSQISSGESSGLTHLEVKSSFDVPVNFCNIILDTHGDISPMKGDNLIVELGNKKAVKVFTGIIDCVKKSISSIKIESYSSFLGLVDKCINVVYEEQSCGDIVNDIAQKCQVEVDTVDEGLTFPYMVLDSSRNLWQHLKDLSVKCHTDIYANGDDKLVFKEYSASSKHEFAYSVNILDYEYQAESPVFDGVEVFGESPVGQGESEEAVMWLRKEEVKGTAGESSGNILRIIEPTAKNQDLADSLANNIYNTNTILGKGKLRVINGHNTKVGETLKISDIPDESANGTYKIVGINHILNKDEGFYTEIEWEERA